MTVDTPSHSTILFGFESFRFTRSLKNHDLMWAVTATRFSAGFKLLDEGGISWDPAKSVDEAVARLRLDPSLRLQRAGAGGGGGGSWAAAALRMVGCLSQQLWPRWQLLLDTVSAAPDDLCVTLGQVT